MKTTTEENETEITNGRGKTTRRNKFVVEFPMESKLVRHIELPNSDARRNQYELFHCYPSLSAWPGGVVPDTVNPRSHDDDALKSEVAREIEDTILNKPEEFVKANRGLTLLVDGYEYDKHKEIVRLTFSDPETQGVADGGTTDRIIGKIQRELLDGKELSQVKESEFPDSLRNARVHLEIWQNMGDREQIAPLVAGRNTSRQVKAWSLANFSGRFDWIKDVFGKDSPYYDKIGWEENSPKPMTVLQILALATLVHKNNEEDDRTPVAAYSGKGRLEQRLHDEATERDYQALSLVLNDLVNMYELIYATLPDRYERAFKSVDKDARFGRRAGVKPLPKPKVLPMTGRESDYSIPTGYIYPLVASLRAIIGYKRDGLAFWRVSPEKFWEDYGAALTKALIAQLESSGVNNNPNKLGKTATVYSALYEKAENLYMKSKHRED